MERIQYAKPEERDRFMQELFAPPMGADPDNVSEYVIEEEMALFSTLKRQTERR